MHTTFRQSMIPFKSYPVFSSMINHSEGNNKDTSAVKEYKTVSYIGSSVAAVGANKIIKVLFGNIVFKPLNMLLIKSGKLSLQEHKECDEGARGILKTSKSLSTKGIIIKYLGESESNRNELLEKNGKVRFLPYKLHKIKYFYKKVLKRRIRTCHNTINGENACYIEKEKAVWINEKKLMGAVFHELGHAKSYTRPIPYINMAGAKIRQNIPLMLAVAILLPKQNNEKPNTAQKMNNCILKAIPVLALIGHIPLLLEEARASLYGLQFAKKVLKPTLYKKLVKSYKLAYLSYTASAIAAFTVLKGVIYTKDKSGKMIREFLTNKKTDSF